MTRGDLPKVTFLGRPIKPLAAALAVSMFTVFYFNIVDNSGILVDTLAGDIVAYVALASCVTLIMGWVLNHQCLTETGILLSAGVWVSRAALVILLGDWSSAALFFSLAWVVASVGAYFLESLDDDADFHWTYDKAV